MNKTPRTTKATAAATTMAAHASLEDILRYVADMLADLESLPGMMEPPALAQYLDMARATAEMELVGLRAPAATTALVKRNPVKPIVTN